MTKLYTTFLFAILCTGVMHAQLSFNFSDVTAQNPGDTIDVDVSVDGFTDLVTFQTSINWDADVFSFAEVTNLTEDLNGFSLEGNVGVPDGALALTDGQMTIVWNDGNASPNNLADGTILMTIRLVAVGSNCDKSSIDISNTPRSFEFINSALNKVDVSSTAGELIIDNGSVTCGDPGMSGIGITIGDLSATKGSQVCVPVTASDFDNVESFQFGLQWDPSILSLATEDDPGMDGVKDGKLMNVNANATQADQGRLRVIWFIDSDAVSAEADETLLEICFDVIGETGENTDLEIVGFPNANPPFRIEISVEGMTGDADFFTNDGKLTVGSDPGGRNGAGFIFDDLYTEGASSICVPLKVENFDSLVGLQTGVSFDASVLTYTGSQNAYNGLQIGEANKDNGELRLIWSDQQGNANTLDDGTVFVELCFDVVGADGASSSIGFINIPPNFGIEVLQFPDRVIEFFTEDGSVTVGNRPEPLDTLAINVADVTFDSGDTVCVDFEVENYSNIGGIGMVVSWDESVLTFVEVRNANLPQLTTGNSNFRFIDPNSVRVLHTPNAPQTVDDGTSIFQICYEAIPGCDSGASTNITIGGDSNVSFEILNGNDEVVPVNVKAGIASAQPCSSEGIVIEATQVRMPSCVGASNGAVIIEVRNAVGSFMCDWTKDGESVQVDNCLLNGVTAGTYVVTVTDDLDSTATATFTITDPSPIAVSEAVVETCPDEGSSNGVVRFSFAGGDGNYTIVSTGDGTIDGLSITDLPEREFAFVVRDGQGCDMMITFNDWSTQCANNGPIGGCDEARIIISPNGDLRNDNFVIGCLNDPAELTKTNKLEVFDRWGRPVFTADNYRNDWIGTDSDGNELEEGGYMWVFTIGGATDRQVYRGTLTILR